MRPEWEMSLEAALAFAKKSHALPLFSSRSPYADRLRHACRRFAVPYFELRQLHFSKGEELSSESIGWKIGLICRDEHVSCESQWLGTHLEDRGIAVLSNILFALHIRKGGSTERLVRARLEEPSIPSGSTIVFAHPPRKRLRIAPVEEELADLGAVLWISNTNDRNRSTASAAQLHRWGCDQRTVPSTLMPWQEANVTHASSEEFLVHCTRARQGAWPDQSQSEYFDEAIRLVWGPITTPIETLARILTQQRLFATHSLRRGQVATVCFSGRKLDELLAMRSFQSHLSRWDWEPYGIAIRRDWLTTHGAQPVEYLSRKDIRRAPQERLPFVQPTPDRTGGRDWRVEREWRVAGDVRLNSLDVDQGFVFVPSRQEAQLLAPLSRWPIVVLQNRK